METVDRHIDFFPRVVKKGKRTVRLYRVVTHCTALHHGDQCCTEMVLGHKVPAGKRV